MKTLNTLALTVLLTSMSVSAQDAAETTREINAQTTVTRGHIDNILQRMNDRRTDSRFNACRGSPTPSGLKRQRPRSWSDTCRFHVHRLKNFQMNRKSNAQ